MSNINDEKRERQLNQQKIVKYLEDMKFPELCIIYIVICIIILLYILFWY